MKIDYPLWFLLIDYGLGILMWLLLLKFILSLFFSESSKSKIILKIYNFANFILGKFYTFTPKFLPDPIIPLYFSWILFLIRFYILPLALGYPYIGKFAFTFEKDLLTEIKAIFLSIAINLNYGI